MITHFLHSRLGVLNELQSYDTKYAKHSLRWSMHKSCIAERLKTKVRSHALKGL